MTPDDIFIELITVDMMHEEGYIADEAYERYMQQVGNGIVEEHERYKRPRWKIW